MSALDAVRARQVEDETGLTGDELIAALDRRARKAQAHLDLLLEFHADLRVRHCSLARLLLQNDIPQAGPYLQAVGE